MIIIGNSVVTFALISILIVSIALEKTALGFVFLLLASMLIGIGANLSQLTFFAMINYLSQDVVSKFTVGTALSGLMITGIRMIILAIAGPSSDSATPIIIYFAIALIFNTCDMFLNIWFCKSSVYKHKIDRFLLHHDSEKDHPA
jgi:hypothetical protein